MYSLVYLEHAMIPKMKYYCGSIFLWACFPLTGTLIWIRVDSWADPEENMYPAKDSKEIIEQ